MCALNALTGFRARVGATLRGASVQRILNSLDGAKPYKIAPCSLHPARRALQAVGTAMGSTFPTLCILGDAAIAHGEFHQALDIANQWSCPIIFLLIRYPLTEDAPLSAQSKTDVKMLAKANDINYFSSAPTKEEIFRVVAKASENLSPTLIETILEN